MRENLTAKFAKVLREVHKAVCFNLAKSQSRKEKLKKEKLCDSATLREIN